MSFLRRGERRRGKAATAAMTVAVLGAFQVLAIVGAGTASAVTGCTYNPATDTITVTIDPGQSAGLMVDTAAADVDTNAPAGSILFDNNGAGFGLNTACGSASNSNTVAIIVLGSPGNDETFYIDEAAGGTFNSAIVWNVDLGTSTVAGDWFEFFLNDDVDNALTLTDGSFDLNGSLGEVLGVENYYVDGGAGDDTIDGSALTSGVYLEAYGEAGDDWIAPGLFAGDYMQGNGGTDTVSYATRTGCVAIDNTLVYASGNDANCDGDSLDVGDEADGLGDFFEVLESGSGNDTLVGAAGVDETFVPGDGDDDITGNAGDDDTLDYSSSSAAMTIDPFAGTATGQGDDTFADITGFVGSDFDDVLIWDGSTTEFSGGDGVDTVDASAETTGQDINLGSVSGSCAGTPFTPGDDVENAIGGAGADNICGNIIANDLMGGDGNDTILGFGGNDRVEGGLGNDGLSGGDGADTLVFANAPSGEEIDNQLGFATGGDGEDSIEFFEIVLGSDFADSIVTGQNAFSLNQRVLGRGGDDNIVGSSSSDTLKGGAGDDVVRAGAGDDNLTGNKGNDNLVGGKGYDYAKGGKGHDTCRGVEVAKSC